MVSWHRIGEPGLKRHSGPGNGVIADIEDIAFETDAGLAARARIGLIVLASDHTVEYEFRRIIDLPGVAVYQSRIPNSPVITPDTLAAMERHIPSQSSVILPGVTLDVVA